jgi:hypothetical protein
MKKIQFLLMSILMLMFYFSVTVSAQENLTAEQIITKANEAVFYAGRDANCDVEMTVLGSYTQEENWRFKITRLTDEKTGEQKFRVVFQDPGFMKDVAYLVWKRPGQEDVRWISIPVMDFLRRIEAENEKRFQFFGTHLRYEDWAGRPVAADRYEVLESNGDGYYLIKAIPKKKNVEFSYYLVWVRQSDFVPVKIEFYNKKNTLIRLIEVVDVENIEGYSTVTRALIKDLQYGGETHFHFTNISYNTGLNEDVYIEVNQGMPLKNIR